MTVASSIPVLGISRAIASVKNEYKLLVLAKADSD